MLSHEAQGRAVFIIWRAVGTLSGVPGFLPRACWLERHSLARIPDPDLSTEGKRGQY